MSRASAAVAGIANRAWIFAHLAHGSRARAKDLHRRAFRPATKKQRQGSRGTLGSLGCDRPAPAVGAGLRSEEHTSELQSLMRNSYAVFCLTQTTTTTNI